MQLKFVLELLIFIIVLFVYLRHVTLRPPDVSSAVMEKSKNLTKITWAHAVNDRAYLESALASEVAMLEADIVLGHIKGSEDEPLIPIMAHPPANVSDLTLAEFLNAVAEHNKAHEKKGVKLDFKSIEAFEAAQEEIMPFNEVEANFPVWLNADILSGPVEATSKPVDPHRFLNLSSHYPQAVLSIGWTTRWLDGNTEGYSSQHIDAMVQVLNKLKVKQTVTFPVRASIAAFSHEVLQKLLSETSHLNSTLTIWDSAADAENVEKLRTLILQTGLDRTYLDVRKELADKLHLPSEDD